MRINKLTQNEIYKELNLASEGRFYHWNRTYVLQVDQKIFAVSLNLFERMGKFFYGIFGQDYFKRIFKDKSVHMIFTIPAVIKQEVSTVVEASPKFSNYGYSSDPQVHMTDLSFRPSNLFYAALLGEDKTTMPGSGKLFSFIDGNQKVRKKILNLKDDEIIEFKADRKAKLYARSWNEKKEIGDVELTTYLGNGTFRISGKELKEQLQSQEVHLSSLLPRKFYLGLKEALKKEHVIALPGYEDDMYDMVRLSNEKPAIKDFLQEVEKDPGKYDLTSHSFKSLKELTLYQIGSMVVKTEKYHSFVGDGLKLRERQANTKDVITLISACGIRGFHTDENHAVNGNAHHGRDREIMKQTFKCALDAAKTGFVLFPAVGMGIWGGDPDVYWRAFFEAVIASNSEIEYIFINPGHKSTSFGPYKGRNGDEFDTILAEYGDNPKLLKIINLYRSSTDLLLLAQNLKSKFPEKNVSLFNASDPDVTLGNHVGEYVNNLCHANTTEENYAAAGSSCLGFEDITEVLSDNNRVIQH